MGEYTDSHKWSYLGFNLMEDVMVHDPLISDRCAIFMHLLLHKPQFPRKTIRHRKLRSIDYAEFNDTIMNSSLFDESRLDLDSLVDSYHQVLKSTLYVYAPERTRQAVLRPCAPWFQGSGKNYHSRSGFHHQRPLKGLSF